jgi:hypothetical protein
MIEGPVTLIGVLTGVFAGALTDVLAGVGRGVGEMGPDEGVGSAL